ncbi:MAG: hypothetical protein MUF23_07095 [Pirellula sp.]|jgi:hypothetical protein|nr:hypothetical protein [Pirellula sp.]
MIARPNVSKGEATMLIRSLLLLVMIVSVAVCNRPSLAQSPEIESYLVKGEAEAGVVAMLDRLAQSPSDDHARFSLGVAQFFVAVEHLGQGFYEFGLRDPNRSIASMLPFLRLPIPFNDNPRLFSYQDSRNILQRFIDDLAVAEKSLSEVDDTEVKLRLPITRISLNFADASSPPVPLRKILIAMRSIRDQQDFVVVFDRADVAWLRGYCHLLTAMCEFLLAHDGQELFDATAHLFFQRVDTPFTFLPQGQRVYDFGGGFDIADVIAMIHLIRLPATEPLRMQAALHHLEQVLEQSEEMWKFAIAETDDDHEWIPNARQTGELRVPVTQDMIESWLVATKEGKEVLRGERLIPFWRGNGEQGVNLRRVFTEPTTFDLVLWIQGTAAAPYLETGEKTRPDVWWRLQQVFQGNFIVFALWFN